MDIGPTLPPNFREPKPSDSEDSDSDTHTSESLESDSDSHPSPRRGNPIGPVLPKGFKLSDTNDDTDSYGPVLPPTMKSNSNYGPSLPSGFSQTTEEDVDDEDMIGPRPTSSDQVDTGQSAAAEFERRAQRMKNKLEHGEDEGPVQRESWMLELPEKMRMGVGLQARTFKSSRSTAESDSSWTETPSDRMKREQEGKSRKRGLDSEPVKSQRDMLMQEQVDTLNAKRQKSLYELHQEKMHGKKEKKTKRGKDKDKKKKDKKSKEKKKKEKEKKKKSKDEKPERRPFDRDQDLKVNRFDDAMRKHYIKKAQGLGSNFSHSAGGNKFL